MFFYLYFICKHMSEFCVMVKHAAFQHIQWSEKLKTKAVSITTVGQKRLCIIQVNSSIKQVYITGPLNTFSRGISKPWRTFVSCSFVFSHESHAGVIISSFQYKVVTVVLREGITYSTHFQFVLDLMDIHICMCPCCTQGKTDTMKNRRDHTSQVQLKGKSLI